MKVKNVTLVDFDGNPLRGPTKNDEVVDDLTVAYVLGNSALSAPGGGKPYTPDQATARYVFALAMYKAKIGDDLDFEVNLPDGGVVDLKDALIADFSRLYGPIVVGQLLVHFSTKQ